MARLWSSGFELNSLTIELTGTTGGAAITVQTGTVRSGTYSLKCASGGATIFGKYQFAAANANGPYFSRIYINFSALPASETTIMGLVGTTATIFGCALTIDQNGTLRLYNGNRVATLVGTSASNLSTNTWYCLEIKYDKSQAAGSQILQARIDQGTAFGATNLTVTNAVAQLLFGHGCDTVNDAETTAQCFIDDVAINDNTGSAQTGYPGAGSIIHMNPDSAGDNAQWTQGAGGTNNWDRVNDYTTGGKTVVDDATTYNKRTTTNLTDDHNFESSSSRGIGASDTITLVQVGVRGGSTGTGDASNARDATLRIKSQASGTVLESAAVTLNLNGWVTNGNAAPHNYFLTSYTDPQAGGAWTPTLLNAMQAGYRGTSTSGTSEIRVSTLWVLVEYVPSTTSIKTVNGLAKASVKTVNGLAIASVKTINGLA